MTTARILSWDIEASNLSADFGVVLTVGFTYVDSPEVEVLRIDDYGKDILKAEKAMLKDVSKRLMAADIWLTHFGTWYDINFINSRLLYHRLPVIAPNHPHIDTWKIAKNRLKLRNNRLVTISEFLKTGEEKNSIRPEQWLYALGLKKSAIDYIVEHCRRDVVVLKEVYLLIRPLITNHPHMGFERPEECPVCGKGPLVISKHRRTRTRFYTQFQCKNCGSYSTDTKSGSKRPRMVVSG